MDTIKSPLIEAVELLAISKSKNLVIVDASNQPNSKADYEQSHLAGALFVNLNSQLANIKENATLGGRHPLPTLEQFSQTLSTLGISKNSHVVIYDHKNASNAAARFWWMLKSISHNKVQVLNGGFDAAVKASFPTEKGSRIHLKSESYTISNWQLPLSDIEEVETASQDENYTIIDVRENNRYLGIHEPIDLVAGHIPGAENIPFSENLDSNGFFLSPSALRTKYQPIFDRSQTENIIIHCGSGVTACHTILAIVHAGFEIPKLYVGSWSEWSRNNKPISTRTI